MANAAFQNRRPDRLYGYLLERLRSGVGPWSTLRGDLRFAGNRALHVAGQAEFEQLARYLCERFAARSNPERPMRLGVLTAQEPNAFATAPVQCDAVLLTLGAFDRIQKLAHSSALGMQALLEHESLDFPLLRIWASLTVSEETLSAFGSVVAHGTIAVLVHHEIAHLVLGHEWHWRYTLDRDVEEADPNQCLELDADLHALNFTEHYFAERLAQVPQDGDPLNAAWHHFLDDAGSRSLVVLLCAFLFLLAVDFHDRAPEMAPPRTDSHPHVAVRQLLALLVQQRWRQVATRDAMDLVYFVAATNAGTSNTVSASTTEQLSHEHGLQVLSSDPDVFKDHIEALGKQLARYETRLKQLMRLPAEQRIRWFAS